MNKWILISEFGLGGMTALALIDHDWFSAAIFMFFATGGLLLAD